MDKRFNIVMLTAALVMSAHSVTAQDKTLDLNGEWQIDSPPDRGIRVLIIQTGSNVKATFIHRDEPGNYSEKCDNGGERDHLFEAQLQGTSLKGKMMRCTRWDLLVKDCGLDSAYETTFDTTVSLNDFIKGTYFAEGIAYDEKNGHLVNCHRDDKFNSDKEFNLVRKCDFSGLDWVKRYPDSKSTDDLEPKFRAKANKFLAALGDAGATTSIETTRRPVERSYLMHYAWQIAKNNLDPRKVPGFAGVEICWVHRKADGDFDLAASRAAAQEMIGPKPGYNMAADAYFDPNQSSFSHDPNYSRHNLSQAIDMTITWTGDLTIKDANGNTVTITSTPRNGADNADLQAVGASYGVFKVGNDPPHWSSDHN